VKDFIKKYLSKLFPNYVKAYRRKKVLKVMSKEPQILENGLKFYGIQNAYNYEPSVMSNIQKLAQKYDYFVNIGANHGLYVFSLQHYFKKIIACEALHENIQLIGKNILTNSLQSKIFIAPYAASKDKKILKFYGASTGGSLVKGFNQQFDDGVYVQAISIDDLVHSHLADKDALYLIDVEGAEWDVLQGAKRVISNSKSTFIVEISCRGFMPNEEFHQSFIEIFKLFFDQGYSAQEILADGSLVELTLNGATEMVIADRWEGFMAIFERD
jgi:FkbM family methyltransferase